MGTSGRGQSGQCECGENKFEIRGKPLFRAICHCEICQEFNDAPFADIAIYKRRDVDLPAEHSVTFKAYTSPPMVQRGKCAACGKPAIEFMKMPLSPALTIVPTQNICGPDPLPTPAFHSFYHRRREDAHDEIPKYSGFLKSQLGFVVRLMRALISARKQ